MTDALASVDRFFKILTASEDKNNQRFIQQWSYLYNLLRTEPVAHDRIEAYLNILENHDCNTKKHIREAKKSLTEHPRAKDLGLCLEEILGVLDAGAVKLRPYDRND